MTVECDHDEYGPILRVEDEDGDLFSIEVREDGAAVMPAVNGAGAYLTREDARALYDYLGDWLGLNEPRRPDAEADGYAWDGSTIALDAHAAVHGPRQADYGHPREDFTRTAILWTGLLHHKLADGQYVEAEDIARCMIAVKLSRDVHTPKRDNRVDGAGYFITLDRLETGQ